MNGAEFDGTVEPDDVTRFGFEKFENDVRVAWWVTSGVALLVVVDVAHRAVVRIVGEPQRVRRYERVDGVRPPQPVVVEQYGLIVLGAALVDVYDDPREAAFDLYLGAPL